MLTIKMYTCFVYHAASKYILADFRLYTCILIVCNCALLAQVVVSGQN